MLSIKILQDARVLSSRLNHRGAQSADNNTGDGAGVLTAVPHAMYASVVRYDSVRGELRSIHFRPFVDRQETGVELPPAGHYATGICFTDEASREESESMFQEIALECALQVEICVTF